MTVVSTPLQSPPAVSLRGLTKRRIEGRLADGEPAAAAFNSGYHLAYLVGAGLVAVAMVLALAVLRSQPQTEQPADLEAPQPKLEPAYCEAA